MSGATIPAESEGAVDAARRILEAHWREPGFCVPNATTYPWQWLWDSCFHAVCWAHLGEGDRAIAELTNALAHQDAEGFVPHMTYWHDGSTHADFWGRAGTSTVTQPPMYGHALAELHRCGVGVPAVLVERASLGLRYLLTARMRGGAGPVIVHPWESGCDDSARWDAWCPPLWSFERWKGVKGELVAALVSSDEGSGRGSDRFEVASAGFGALVAFNARELATVTGSTDLLDESAEVVARIDERWDAESATWRDEVVVGSDATAGIRTREALLPRLVSDHSDAIETASAQIIDDGAFGGAFGPAATHRDEPTFDPTAYWRGPAWPQLTYLHWVGAVRRGDGELTSWLAGRLVAGARQSGYAEYWHPDSGAGLGAVPQSWTALAAVVQAPRA